LKKPKLCLPGKKCLGCLPDFVDERPMHKSLSKNAMRDVLAFLFRHWRREAAVVTGTALSMAVATVADLLLPVFSGRLVDAIASHDDARAQAFHAAVQAIIIMAILGAVLMAARYLAMLGIIRLTLRLMSRFASDAFWRVQRFSTDWQANNFAGSIVRRVTRGMWAVDLMDDTLLLALLPALLVLAGSSLLLGLHWPSMGLIVAAGATLYVAISVALSLGYVAPAARLSNAQDTRVGGAMADAITCNAVVKSFGAESREDLRLARVLDKWQRRTFRTWTFGTRSGSLQLMVLLALRTVVTLYAVLLWWRGDATPGDVTFVLTSYFIVHGYLRDIGSMSPTCNEASTRWRRWCSCRPSHSESPTRPVPRRSVSETERSSSITSHSGTACIPRRSSTTSPCVSRQESGSGWWGTPAPAKQHSLSSCIASTMCRTAAF
jgi:ATP-binding cassette subfamily B protein